MINVRAAVCAILPSTSASASYAASITLESVITPIAINADVTKVPDQIASGAGRAVSTGLLWSGGSGSSDSLTDRFIAWCFDIVLSFGLGETYEYEIVDAPFSGSDLLAGAAERVSKVINASYDALDPFDAVQAAGFQLAVWDVSNDDDFSIGSGVFQANGAGRNGNEISKAAQSFLTAGRQHTRPNDWQPIFLETREARATQNLVTAVKAPEITPVPLPATGLVLIASLLGLFAFGQRKAAIR